VPIVDLKLRIRCVARSCQFRNSTESSIRPVEFASVKPVGLPTAELLRQAPASASVSHGALEIHRCTSTPLAAASNGC